MILITFPKYNVFLTMLYVVIKNLLRKYLSIQIFSKFTPLILNEHNAENT